MQQTAKGQTITILWAAIATALLFLAALARFFKDWKEVAQGVQRAFKGVGLIWRTIMKMFIWRRDMELMLKRMETMIARMDDKVELIKKEVQYNGSTSLKDAAKRIEVSVSKLETGHYNLSARLHLSALAQGRMEFKLNNQGAWLEGNEIFLRRFGWHPNDMEGFGYENMIHPEDLQEWNEKVERAIDQCSRIVDELRIKNSNGEWFRVCMEAMPICNSNKEVVDFVGLIRIIENK